MVASLALGLGLLPARAYAAGFINDAQSPAGVGLAGAMVARPDDASAIYYNPAGLGFQSGLSVLAGISLINLQQSVTDSGGNVYNAQPNHVVVPTVFAAARVSDHISLGLGVFVNHGLAVDWQNPDNPQPFPGRYKALSISLQSFTLNPTVTMRPIPEIAIGAGLDIELGSLELIRALALGSADGLINLSGSTVAVGGNIGALVRLLDGRLNLGLTFRSGLDLHFAGMQVSATAPPGVSLVFPYNQATTDVIAPHTVTFGAAGKPLNWLTLSADFITTLWSDVHEQRVVFSDGMGNTQISVNPRNWHDAYSGRLGIEADLGTAFLPRSKLWPKVRVGIGYDESPVSTQTQDTSSPDSDRILVSAGVSLGYRGLGSIELGYMAVIFREHTSDNPDLPLTYDSMIHTFSAAVVVQLDRVFGKRSAAYAGRQLERSPEQPPESGNSAAESQ